MIPKNTPLDAVLLSWLLRSLILCTDQLKVTASGSTRITLNNLDHLPLEASTYRLREFFPNREAIKTPTSPPKPQVPLGI